MSDITTTITKLQAHFKAWHTEEYEDLHKETTQYIDDQINTWILNNQESTAIINNQIKEIGNYLCRLIDGVSYDGNINNIGNTLNNKNYNLESNNLKQLVSKINQNTNNIAALQSQDYATKQYVDTAISTNGMKTIAITSGKNLNNYTTFGFYKSVNSTISNSLTQTPTKEPFILIVIDASDNSNNNIKQILSTINTNRTFTRSKINGNWGDWAELYDTNNTATLGMTVEFEDGRPSQTYTLLKK